jgi:hypothetical protein
MRLGLLGILIGAACSAQEYRVLPPEPNTITGAHRGAAKDAATRTASFGRTDQVFPQIATGGGWETVIVIVNMSPVRMNYTQRFYSSDGRPMNITFREYPSGNVVTTTAIEGWLSPGCSFNFALFDSTPNTQIGWATLTYDGSLGRLGAYAIFRSRVAGRTDFEALVPLSRYDDHVFFMPFDNIQGFTTAMAIDNPASNMSNNVTITAFDLRGQRIGSALISLPRSGHTAFALTDKIPALAGSMGTLLVESDTNRLSALGLRFNSGGAFASIPIMNYEAMLE